MSGWATALYVCTLLTAAFLFIVLQEIHQEILIPLQSTFILDPTMTGWGDLMIEALIPLAIVFAASIWYLGQIQKSKELIYR